jgi:membrane-bound lytic murein transglycosylase A
MKLNFSSVAHPFLLLVFIAGCSSTPIGVLPSNSSSTVPALPSPHASIPPTVSHDKPDGHFKAVTFAALPGWLQDDPREALPAFRLSCSVLIKKPEWKDVCNAARDVVATDLKATRHFFELYFTPYQVTNADGSVQGLVTGYYEPLLHGSRRRSGVYQTPLYRTPDDLINIDLAGMYPELKNLRLRGRLVANKIIPYWSRAELAQSSALIGKELVWVDDPIDAFFLQVQGSGRIQLADTNDIIRVAYADQNGHPYKSIGRYLVDQGELALEQASAQSIKAWYAAHPTRQQELINSNPSYVFFKEEKITDPKRGPNGSLGIPLTPQRSIAIDTRFLPLGAPVYLSTTQPNSAIPLQRLMMAQDTGGAIRNAVRADYFWGFGHTAGEQAGKMRQQATMWLLLPKSITPGQADH